MWALLLITLPTQPNAVRLHAWRALRTLGGADLLPAAAAARFEPWGAGARELGGSATLPDLTPRDKTQRQELPAPGRSPGLRLADSAVHRPRGALRRADGADPRVSFEVRGASFGLEDDFALQRIAQSVHHLDVGGIPAPAAAGLEAVLGGLRALHANDDALRAAACTMFDALYATPATPTPA